MELQTDQSGYSDRHAEAWQGDGVPSLAGGVTIHGGGVAARCCARLLSQAGIGSRLLAGSRTSSPAILLGNGALALLRDCLDEPQFLASHKRIRRRVVAWGQEEPVAVPHEALSLAGGDLDAAFATLKKPSALSTPAPAMAIHASPPFPSGTLHRFGSRSANAVPVLLRCEEDEDSCWIEAVEHGWLFMIPTAPGTGWLLAVGAPVETLLATSRNLALRVAPTGSTQSTFETAPRMLERVSGPGWIACGTEAIAFDPLCGDGTAQAAREALLASAVVAELAKSPHDALLSAELLDHYHSMVLASMRRHLRLCAQFYSTGGQDPWWRKQLAATAEAFEWCSEQLARFPEPRFRLHGMGLVRNEVTA